MKQKLAIVVLSALTCSAALAQSHVPGMGGTGSMDPGAAPPMPNTSAQLPTEPEAWAEDRRLNGKCEDAIPIFRQLAARGAGYELAEYHLGLCLFDLSKTEPDAQRVVSLKHEAVDCIAKAAKKGLPNAQRSLVTIYLDGNGVDSDPMKAGMWALIYRANGARFVIGLPDISPDLQARLDSVLTDKNWSDAQSRADAWAPDSQNWQAAN
jgi:hypothetical protein